MMANAGVAANANAPKRRKARQWIALTLLCLGIHIGLIWFLGGPSARWPAAPQPAPRIQLLADSLLSEQLTSSTELSDPANFALPAVQGFSGFAWLTFVPLQPEFSGSIAPPHWLEVKEDDLANVFERLFPTNPVTTLQIADLPLPPLVGAVPQVEREVLLEASSVRAEGALTARMPSGNIALPPWRSPEILTNTVVQVLLDAEGQCLSSLLLSGCGSKEADTFAQKWVRDLPFKPLRARERLKNTELVACGKLIFQWQTLPPSTQATPASAAARIP